MPEITKQDMELIERIIDRIGWSELADAVSRIAYEKSQHVQENWQDQNMAKTLERVGRKFEKLVPALALNDEVLGHGKR